jgi:hypothetical protein
VERGKASDLNMIVAELLASSNTMGKDSV